ncbi:MAG: AAA family ATPase [Saprospirales bacterium]|nr:AAA family ATPase [Saprospirales bacterium]
MLLHGLPGTGKTTYLRYLIGKVKKRVLFVPPSVAANITNPEFMNLLLDYPNSVLIIEDAENIIMDRQITGSSAVSNLLNISDGLLGDCLNTQIICTFNMPISKIDSALMRKGRLIAKYNFGKLSVGKAQQLADKMKLEINVTEPMTVAEIFNKDEKTFDDKRINVVGFRRKQ